MAEQATRDRHHSAVLIMDFQVRIINNFASDPPGLYLFALRVHFVTTRYEVARCRARREMIPCVQRNVARGDSQGLPPTVSPL